MSYSSTIITQFPNAAFTGGSAIHHSLARTCVIKHGRENVRAVMAPLLYANVGSMIFTFLRGTFPGMEWLVKGPQLAELLAVDFYRHLTKQGDAYTASKLKNPVTGNRFHLVALKDTTVCGIRVWAHGMGNGTELGYRFRLEEQKEKDATTRGRAVQLVIDAHAELAKIIEELQLPPLTSALAQNAALEVKGLVEHQVKYAEGVEGDLPY